MWLYGYSVPQTNNELYHYGVLGMRWGVHRSIAKQRENTILTKKALNYDIKSEKLYKKAEKHHTINDLESANKMAKKAAKYEIKSSRLEKSANNATDELRRSLLEKRSENMAYKATKAKMKANRISRTTGYGMKAMKYAIKSDKVAIKAAAARKKIASNEFYTAMLKRKLSTLPKEELAKVEKLLTSE